jgi:hypothetical protein
MCACQHDCEGTRQIHYLKVNDCNVDPDSHIPWMLWPVPGTIAFLAPKLYFLDNHNQTHEVRKEVKEENNKGRDEERKEEGRKRTIIKNTMLMKTTLTSFKDDAL